MRIRRLSIICFLVLMTAAMTMMAACGKDAENDNSGKSQAGATEAPIDIVSQVVDGVDSQKPVSEMDEGQKQSYMVLLDGCSDSEAGYYIHDLTGDAVPELLLGTDIMSVYSYNQGSVMTIGTLAIQEAYLSEQYGFLAICENDGSYELRCYAYDGEMFTEKVLVTASGQEECKSQAADYLQSAQTLQRYELSDRTLFE